MRFLFVFFTLLCASHSAMSHPHVSSSWLCETPTLLYVSSTGKTEADGSGADFVLVHEEDSITIKYPSADLIYEFTVHEYDHLRTEALGFSHQMGTISVKEKSDGFRLSWIKTLHSFIQKHDVQFASGTCQRLPE